MRYFYNWKVGLALFAASILLNLGSCVATNQYREEAVGWQGQCSSSGEIVAHNGYLGAMARCEGREEFLLRNPEWVLKQNREGGDTFECTFMLDGDYDCKLDD